MRINLIACVILGIFSISPANKSLLQIERLTMTDRADSARFLLEQYNEENLFNPATFLGGVLAKEGGDAFKKFKSLEPVSMESEKKQQALFQIAHYYYLTDSPGMAISYFRKSILSHPQGEIFENSHYWMGIVCAQYGKKKSAYLDSADAHFRFLADIKPRDKWYSLGLAGIARVRMIKRDYKSVKTILDLARENGSSRHAGYINYTSWLLAKKQHDSTASHLYAANLHAYQPDWLETDLVPFAKLPEIPEDSLDDDDWDSDTDEDADSSAAAPENTDDKPAVSTLSIQLAAYTIETNANEFLQKLDYMNINAQIVKETRNDVPYFLVRIVGFADRESADSFAENNLKSRGISYYVVHPN